jgi:hypothetical protein
VLKVDVPCISFGSMAWARESLEETRGIFRPRPAVGLTGTESVFAPDTVNVLAGR